MNKIKAVLMAAVLMVSAYAAAQTPPGPGQGGQERGRGGQQMQQAMEKIHLAILKELDLSEEQKSKIVELTKARDEAIKNLRTEIEAGNVSREEARPKQQAITEKFRKEFIAVLTPEQKAKYEARMKEEMAKLRERMGQRGGGQGRGGNPPTGGSNPPA